MHAKAYKRSIVGWTCAFLLGALAPGAALAQDDDTSADTFDWRTQATLSIMAGGGVAHNNIDIPTTDEFHALAGLAFEVRPGELRIADKVTLLPVVFARFDRNSTSDLLLDRETTGGSDTSAVETAEMRVSISGKLLVDLGEFIATEDLVLAAGGGLRAVNWASGRNGMALLGPELAGRVGWINPDADFGPFKGYGTTFDYYVAWDSAQVEHGNSVLGDPQTQVGWDARMWLDVTETYGVGVAYLGDFTFLSRLDSGRVTHLFSVLGNIKF